MADYLPLIARAVEALEKNTGENRRALYERARTALVAQLRGVQPALEESEITRERLALEEAIRKIEADSARRAREEPRSPPPRRQDAARQDSARQDSARQDTRQDSPPKRDESSYSSPPREAPPPRSAPRERPSGERLSLSDEALKGFRDVVGETTSPLDLGRTNSRFTPTQRPTVPLPQPSSIPPAPPQYTPQDLDQADPRGRHDNLWALPLESASPEPSPDYADPHAAEAHAPEPRPGAARPRAPRQSAPPDEPMEQQPRVRPVRRSYPGLIRIALALILIAAIGTGVWWKWDAFVAAKNVVAEMVSSKSGSTPAARNTTAPAARPKIADRIGQPTPSSSNAPAVAQRVVLYEEEPDNPQGKQLTGQAVWRTEMTSPAPGRAPELVVKADVTVPERNLTMTWALRRNTDPSLPASHTIEIMFTLPANSPTGGVQNVPGVLMKQSESTRGVPLAGLAVKVTPGFFLIGLSALDADMQRNLQLLKDRPWFDIPIVYNNSRRAILAMEKGTPGEKAFAEAFAAWKQ